MSLTPDATRPIANSRCSKCGALLLVNNKAIVHEGMNNKNPLILGTCCTDLVLGALIQDYANAICGSHFEGEWIKSNPYRRERISRAAKELEMAYRSTHSKVENNYD